MSPRGLPGVAVAVAAGAIAAAAGARPAAAAPAVETTTTPYPGIRHEVWRDPAIPARAHVVRVDLTLAELTLFATGEAERGARTSAFAAAKGAQVAINGDAFAPAGYVPRGLALGDGGAWSTTADDGTSGFLRFGRVGERTVAVIVPPEDVVAAADLPAATQGVVSGRPLLVRAGQPTTGFDCADEVAIPCVRAPRTAVAVSVDGATLWLVVVDGWQPGSAGMTATELAAFVDGLGGAGGAAVGDALALDGGGASTLVVAGEGGVVNAPSDGAERVVANHLAIRHGALPPGQLVGFIRERDVFDEAASLAGVVVTLDDGRTDTTGADGFYNFPAVSPRLACVTAALDGYRTEHRCRQVVGELVNYNSIAMFPCTDFPDGCDAPPDAGVPPDAPAPVDAAPAVDADPGAGGDAGEGGGGGGGCDAGGAPGSPLAAGAVIAVSVALRRRRRARDPGRG